MAPTECEGRPDNTFTIAQIVHKTLPARVRVRHYQIVVLVPRPLARPVHKSRRKIVVTSIEIDCNLILRRHH